ncbi:MAG: type II toxin-antitoxin system VapC family toxin [Spirochaetales bacterium]|jgi:toxin FitB|nr:type II toxin-antitoxin system VapC family toxin [Spirochaetales bacterium]
MTIIDTNVFSEIMRPDPDERVIDWMDEQQRKNIGITAITVAEILYGIGSLPEGNRKNRLFDAATAIFDEDFSGRIYAFDHLAAVEYADIVIQRDRIGAPISMPDAQIAAICRISNAALATRNTKDFKNTILSLINPWE